MSGCSLYGGLYASHGFCKLTCASVQCKAHDPDHEGQVVRPRGFSWHLLQHQLVLQCIRCAQVQSHILQSVKLQAACAAPLSFLKLNSMRHLRLRLESFLLIVCQHQIPMGEPARGVPSVRPDSKLLLSTCSSQRKLEADFKFDHVCHKLELHSCPQLGTSRV